MVWVWVYNIFIMKIMSKIVAVFVIIALAVALTGCDLSKETNKNKEKSSAVSQNVSGLMVSYIDVGQGDSILLQCKEEAMLIDAGENDKGSIVVNYLKGAGASHLKYAVGTHPHSDHIGGMDTVIDSIKTDTFICPDTSYSTKTWKDVLSSCKDNNTKIDYAKVNKSYSLGDATFTIFHPEERAIYSECNNFSVVIKVSLGERSFLFTGDAEELAEEEMLKSGYDLQADVLKVGHHGSHSSTSRKFLYAVDPSVAVISCGKNNEYGHPHRETISLLNEEDIEIHRTDNEGTVVITTDGKNLVVEEDKTETQQQNQYVGNKNSKKFHSSKCESLSAMNDNNKVYFTKRQDAVSKGYSPCQSCKP